MNVSNECVAIPVLIIFLVTHTIGILILDAVLIGSSATASVASALSSDQRVMDNTSVDSSMPGGLAIAPSEFLHSGATTKATPLAKRSRSVEDDGRSEVENTGKKSAAEEHIDDKETEMVPEPVRSTGFGDDKFGETQKTEKMR